MNLFLFVDGLSPTTRTIVAWFREKEPRFELSFERLVQFSQDQGDVNALGPDQQQPPKEHDQKSKNI